MLPPLDLALPYYEVLDEEGVERIHDASMRILEEVGIDFRDDEAIAYWKEARADVDGIPGAHRSGAAHGARRQGAGDDHLHRPQPRAQRPRGRAQHGVRANLRLAVRARLRQPPPLQHPRRPACVPQARAPVPGHAPRRGHHLRAGGRRGAEAPPARRLQPAPPLGQAVHGVRPPPGSGPRTRWRWRGSRSATTSWRTTRCWPGC